MACERPRVIRLMHGSVPKCQLPDEAGSYTTEKMLTEDLSCVEDWFELPKPYSQPLPAISTPNQKHQTTLRGTCSIRAVQLHQRISNLGRNKLPTTWAANGNIFSGGMLAQRAAKQSKDKCINFPKLNMKLTMVISYLLF